MLAPYIEQFEMITLNRTVLQTEKICCNIIQNGNFKTNLMLVTNYKNGVPIKSNTG